MSTVSQSSLSLHLVVPLPRPPAVSRHRVGPVPWGHAAYS